MTYFLIVGMVKLHFVKADPSQGHQFGIAFGGGVGVAKLEGEFVVEDVKDSAYFVPAGVNFHCHVEVWKCKWYY